MEPENKDVNENILNETDLSGNIESPSSPELYHFPSKWCSPARIGPAAPPRQCTPGRIRFATPPSPHTPSSLPPSSVNASQALLCYFVAAAPELDQGSTETYEPFITVDYIKSIKQTEFGSEAENPRHQFKGTWSELVRHFKNYVFTVFFLVW